MTADMAALRAQYDKGIELLTAGEFAEGFRLSDASWRKRYSGRLLELPQIPKWRGEDLAGKRVLILGEQGYGDQIMYARFAKLMQAQGAGIIWLCRSPLARLLTRCAGFHAQSLDHGADFPNVSFVCPMGELPLPFFPPLTSPPSAPYLAMPPAVTAPGINIGIAVKGNPVHVYDHERSLPPELADELISTPGAVDLDPSATGAQDFYDTARVIAGLDLVVTVDTSVAHLAGAMGKPVWILLSSKWSDWRWMRHRSDSPWYPTARLFRQQSPGDWRNVLDAVFAELAIRPSKTPAL